MKEYGLPEVKLHLPAPKMKKPKSEWQEEFEDVMVNNTCVNCRFSEEEPLCYNCYGVDGVTEITEKSVCENWQPIKDL